MNIPGLKINILLLWKSDIEEKKSSNTGVSKGSLLCVMTSSKSRISYHVCYTILHNLYKKKSLDFLATGSDGAVVMSLADRYWVRFSVPAPTQSGFYRPNGLV